MDAEKPNTKRCPKCETWKATDSFGRSSVTKDGFKSWCRLCHNAASRAHRLANIEHVNAVDKAYRDSHKAEAAAYGAAYYQRNRTKVDAVNAAWIKAHPEIKRAQAKRYYDADPAKLNDRCRDWRKSNPATAKRSAQAYRAKNPERIAALKRNRKALQKEAVGFHTAADILEIYRLQKGRCAYCRASLSKGYHVDHVTPLSKGGTNWPKNLQLSCSSCNLSKKDKDPLIYARKTGRLL